MNPSKDMNYCSLQLLFVFLIASISSCKNRRTEDDKVSFSSLDIKNLSLLVNEDERIDPGLLRTIRFVSEEQIEITIGSSRKAMSGGGQYIVLKLNNESGIWAVDEVGSLDF